MNVVGQNYPTSGATMGAGEELSHHLALIPLSLSEELET